MEDIDRSLRWFLGIATVAGFLVGAIAVDLVWVWVLCLVVSLAVGFVPRRVSHVRRALHSYQPLLELVADLKQRLEQAQEEKRSASMSRYAAFQQGIEQGRAQVRGSLLSHLVKPPVLEAVGNSGDSLVLLGKTASASAVSVGARFKVVAEATREVKGSVEVIKVDASDGSVEMIPVERDVQRFWMALQEQAVIDPTVPPGHRLDTYDPPALPNAGGG